MGDGRGVGGWRGRGGLPAGIDMRLSGVQKRERERERWGTGEGGGVERRRTTGRHRYALEWCADPHIRSSCDFAAY